MRRSAAVVLVALTVAGAVGASQLVSPPPAQAGLGGVACKVLGTVGEGWWGKVCQGVLGVGGKLLGGGKKVAKVLGNPVVQRGAGLAAILAWVLGGAKWTMNHMASVISATTSPTLTAGWFTGVYLRVEAIAVFFTLLFLCAAAAEALLRSDLALLSRAAFAYLPLSLLLTAVAAPVTMLLVAASDQLSGGLANVAGNGTTHFLTGASAWVLGGLTVADPFFAVMAGGVVVAAGGALWVELLVREIAVYVVVAMLPLVFAAMVWPARRVWAIRTVEVLVALILSKIAIVMVLALGGAALDHAGVTGVSKLLGGLALVILGAFSPWLLLRLIPMAEVASAAVGHIRGHVHATAGVSTPEAALAARAAGRVGGDRGNANGHRGGVDGAAAGGVAISELLEQMQRQANAAQHPTDPPDPASPSAAASWLGSRSASTDQPPSSSDDDHRPSSARAAPSPRRSTETLVPAADDHGEQQEMMVQRDDGGWEPLAQTDTDSPAPPPPSEQPEPPVVETDDPDHAGAPEPVRDPRDAGLGGDGESGESP